MIQFAWDFLPKETKKNRLTKCKRARVFRNGGRARRRGEGVRDLDPGAGRRLDGIVHHFFSGSNVSSRSSELNKPFLDVVG